MCSMATKAMWSVVRQAQECDISQQISLRVMLLKALVLPVMSDGCDVWLLPFFTVQAGICSPVEKGW